MKKLEVFDPAMCCSTGACGVDVDPVLALRGECEIPFIRRVTDELAPRCALAPWLPAAPAGIGGLRQLDR